MISKPNDKKVEDKDVGKTTESVTVAEQFYSWVLERQLTWGVIVLACLTGLIEMLPELAIDNIWYFVSLSAIYFALSSGLSYSVYYLGILFRVPHKVLGEYVQSIPVSHPRKILGKFLDSLVGTHQSYLLNSRVTASASIISFVLWVVVWISKAGFLH